MMFPAIDRCKKHFMGQKTNTCFLEVRNMFHFTQAKSIVVILLILVAAAAIYGFAAANTVPDSGAGDGAGTISGYTISSITYTLNSSNPRNIDAVEFDISSDGGLGDPATVKIELEGGSGTWYDCSIASGHATCDTTTPAQDVEGATSLRVVAVGN
jgi:hypothetical protein